MQIVHADNADNAGHNFDPVTDGRTECNVYEPTVHDKHWYAKNRCHVVMQRIPR